MNSLSLISAPRSGSETPRQPFDSATLDSLVALCSGVEGAGLLAQLRADFERLEAGVRRCATDRDVVALAARSHEIKGLAATLGAGPLTACATAVQDACDHAHAAALMGDLTELLLAEIGAVIAALKRLEGHDAAGQDHMGPDMTGPDGRAGGQEGLHTPDRAGPGRSGLEKTEYS